MWLCYYFVGYISCLLVDLDEGIGVCVSDQLLLYVDSIGLDNSFFCKIVSGEWQYMVMVGGSFMCMCLWCYSDIGNLNVIGVIWLFVISDFLVIIDIFGIVSGGDVIYIFNFYLQDQVCWCCWMLLVNIGYEQECNNFFLDVDMNGVEYDILLFWYGLVYNFGIVYWFSDIVIVYVNVFCSFILGQLLLDFSFNGGKFGINSVFVIIGKLVEVGFKLELLECCVMFIVVFYCVSYINVLQFVFFDSMVLFNSYVLLFLVVSQGVELNLLGWLVCGWNIIVSYSYNFFCFVVQIDEDCWIVQFVYYCVSLWSIYDLQFEVWCGWGFGVGFIVCSSYMVFSDSDLQVCIVGQIWVDVSFYYCGSGSCIMLGICNLFDCCFYSDFVIIIIGVELFCMFILIYIVEF